MFLQGMGRVSLVAVALLMAGVAFAEEKAKEVPHPELPQGAGKIDEKAPKTFTETKSGLKYRILREGKGKKPTADQSVDVNYHGWLDNREVFDSSYKRGKSLSFPL